MFGSALKWRAAPSLAGAQIQLKHEIQGIGECHICMATLPGSVGLVAFKVFVVLRQPFLFWRSHVLDCLLESIDLMRPIRRNGCAVLQQTLVSLSALGQLVQHADSRRPESAAASKVSV